MQYKIYSLFIVLSVNKKYMSIFLIKQFDHKNLTNHLDYSFLDSLKAFKRD